MPLGQGWAGAMLTAVLFLAPTLALQAAAQEAGPVSPTVSVWPGTDQAVLISTPFDKFLKYKTYQVTMAGEAQFTGGFVHGPGHHISAMAALFFDAEGRPLATFKTGDTRLSRALRGEPYVATSGIAGRWDKAGVSAGKIVLGELSEEVGGQVVEGTFRRLGEELSPTMPLESTEADEYFMAAVTVDGKPYGDGGQMEVVDLIGPVFFKPQEAVRAMDDGSISDAGRARAMFGRAWAAIGYLRGLDFYVFDHPTLLSRYDTLGLGPALDLRSQVGKGPAPASRLKGDSLKARIDTVAVKAAELVDLAADAHMVDARIEHAVWKTEKARLNDAFAQGFSWDSVRSQVNGQGVTSIPPDFASQYLKLDYDRAKVAVYYLDPELGPMVEMAAQARPALAFAPGSPRVLRRDIRDLKVPRELVKHGSDGAMRKLRSSLPGELRALAVHNAASSGQADLYYHYLGCQVEAPPLSGASDFVSLAEAIRLCRQGHGDAQTEATLLRLADRLDWIPELGMSRSQADFELKLN